MLIHGLQNELNQLQQLVRHIFLPQSAHPAAQVECCRMEFGSIGVLTNGVCRQRVYAQAPKDDGALVVKGYI